MPTLVSFINVWCTHCKKEGEFSHDRQIDWRMIQEKELLVQEGDTSELQSLYAIQWGAVRNDLKAR